MTTQNMQDPKFLGDITAPEACEQLKWAIGGEWTYNRSSREYHSAPLPNAFALGLTTYLHNRDILVGGRSGMELPHGHTVLTIEPSQSVKFLQRNDFGEETLMESYAKENGINPPNASRGIA